MFVSKGKLLNLSRKEVEDLTLGKIVRINLSDGSNADIIVRAILPESFHPDVFFGFISSEGKYYNIPVIDSVEIHNI